MRCQWAGCVGPGHRHDGTWWHCAGHWQEHLALQREDDVDRARCDPRRDTRKRVVELIEGGHRNDTIADRLGVDVSRVYQIRRTAGLVVKPREAKCGTRAGRARHRDLGEDPCTPCIDAEREYQQERYRRKKRGERAA